MLLLMSGVTVTCVTGAYLGYRRLMVASGSATQSEGQD
jgi:hypothetical protein